MFPFYDPITIQDASPYGKQSASSWAVGLTFSLPVFNRNHGNIARAVVPQAAALVERKTATFTAGKISADDFQDNLDTIAEVTQSHRDAILRHRRAMLDLNAAVGLRLLP